jgi:hypothetical protein
MQDTLDLSLDLHTLECWKYEDPENDSGVTQTLSSPNLDEWLKGSPKTNDKRRPTSGLRIVVALQAAAGNSLFNISQYQSLVEDLHVSKLLHSIATSSKCLASRLMSRSSDPGKIVLSRSS